MSHFAFSLLSRSACSSVSSYRPVTSCILFIGDIDFTSVIFFTGSMDFTSCMLFISSIDVTSSLLNGSFDPLLPVGFSLLHVGYSLHDGSGSGSYSPLQRCFPLLDSLPVSYRHIFHFQLHIVDHLLYPAHIYPSEIYSHIQDHHHPWGQGYDLQ